ncbi:hypothetical protein N0V93_008796 [Gnomoniopsis smithogilvyi]|uniref:Nephrocystin 3-like N-terminal domain-containing protein n=1 Tax=Gnomoniopsis smithogilvyi TaxID=1191159 RepID=A0A9W9CV80_9PEZI|nr:hypothetical protein N0V93_008796 [Gnomoniopsis smithogilvyi]
MAASAYPSVASVGSNLKGPTKSHKYMIRSKEALARWSEHVDTLSSEQRRMFLAKLPDNALPRYAELVNSVLDEKFRNSKVIRVTKWIQPLVSFLDLCKPLTDGLRDIYPPAGAILGGVLFALSITKRFVKYQEALVQFLSKVMDGLGQLDRFRDAFPDTPEIQETLVDIFDIILRICARASSIFIDKKGRGKSAARLILKSFDKDFGELKEMLATNIETFDRTIQLVSGRKLGYLEEAQMTGLRMQLETYKEIRKLEAKRTQEERERIARETEREQGTQDSILATTLNGTGKWLLSHQTYTSWRERSAAGLLWVCGKHGSGKSHLAAQVIEELKELCQESNGMIATNQEYIEMEDEVPPHLEVPGVDMPSVDLPGAQQALMLHSNDNIPGDTLEGLAADAHRNLSTEMRNFHGADLEVAEQRSDRVALAYIYCNSERVRRSERVKAVRTAGSGADYDTTGLLSSLLKQLYQFLPKDQDVPALSDLCFESKQDYPSREDISKGITSVVQMFKQVFIVIDGLDECSGLDSLEFETFCNFLASLAEPDGTRSPAHVLIFSRPGYPAINNAMHGCPVVEVDQGANSDDIGRFIGDRSRSLKIDSKSLEVIQGYLQDSADGMFLWVSLTIDSIKNERKPKNMKAAAKNVPKGLSGAYADALKRVIRKEASIRDLALKALLWVANSKAPLSEPQLLEALVIEPEMTSIDDDEKIDGTQLTTDCEDLLVLRDGQYTLLHTSLGDFLRSVPTLGLEDLQIYSTLQAQAPRILVEDCITYFKFDAFATGPQATEDTFDEVLQDHPFLVYAAMFWGDHLREAIEQGAPELESLVIDLLSTQSSREFLHQIRLARDASIKQTNPGLLGQLFPFPSGTTALHVLSIFGLDSLLSADGFRRADLDIGHADGLGYYAIDYAIRYSRRQMCHWIVAEFLKQNDRDEDTTSKLRIACNSETWLMGGVIEHHWTDVLSNLIKLGYSAMERPLEDNRDTALHLAARLGYQPPATIWML